MNTNRASQDVGAALAITWSQIESEKEDSSFGSIEGNQTKNEDRILLPLPFELNEIFRKLPREGMVFDGEKPEKPAEVFSSCMP